MEGNISIYKFMGNIMGLQLPSTFYKTEIGIKNFMQYDSESKAKLKGGNFNIYTYC